jgi:hypothetical protein
MNEGAYEATVKILMRWKNSNLGSFTSVPLGEVGVRVIEDLVRLGAITAGDKIMAEDCYSYLPKGWPEPVVYVVTVYFVDDSDLPYMMLLGAR